MYHIVYLTTNLINNKIYVGVHSTYNLADGYLGSGNSIRFTIKKYGKENFKRQILYFAYDRQQAYEIESGIVDTNFINRKDTYNQVIGNPFGSLLDYTSSLKGKTWNFVLGKEKADILKFKRKSYMIGNTFFKNKCHSIASRNKMSISRKGKLLSESHKNKIGISNVSKTTGNKNIYATQYILTTPQGESIIEFNTINNICKLYNFSRDVIMAYLNKGVIPQKKKSDRPTYLNCIGWSISTLS